MLYFLSSKTTIVLHRLKHAYYLPISQVKSMWWKYSNIYRCLVVLRYSRTSLILPDLNVDPSFCSTVVQLADLHGEFRVLKAMMTQAMQLKTDSQQPAEDKVAVLWARVYPSSLKKEEAAPRGVSPTESCQS